MHAGWIPCALAIAGLGPGAAARAAPETAAEITQCMRDNFPGDASVQTIALEVKDRVGNRRELDAKVYWERDPGGLSRVLIRFDDPPDLRGSSLLLLEKPERNDMFMYLPELGRVRRVTSHMISGSMFGTDFSYEDFERLQGLAEDADALRKPDAEIGGRAAYVLEARPRREERSQYESVTSFIDRETCVPLEIRMYEKGPRLRKTVSIDFSKVTQEKSGWVPRALSIREEIERTETALRVDAIELGVDLPDKLFSQSQLERGGR